MDSWRTIIIALLIATVCFNLAAACKTSVEEPKKVPEEKKIEIFDEEKALEEIRQNEDEYDRFIVNGCVFKNNATWCKNGGICAQSLNSNLHCSCPLAYAGVRCEDEYELEPW